jgi:hypothetical protein
VDLNLLSITLNILTSTSDILSIITSCNYTYRYVNLFNEYGDKFGKLNKDHWTGMFNVECIIKLSILKTFLLVDAISKAQVFVKLKNMYLLYNCNNL